MLQMEALDPEDAAVRARVFAFLAPHESTGLYILGNLNSGVPGTHLYAAVDGGRWLGLAGYYDGPRSLVPCALVPEVGAELAWHILGHHPAPAWLLGAALGAAPALALLLERGFGLLNQPQHVLMEVPLGETLPWPPGPHDGLVRRMRPGDGEEVARLLRLLRDPTNQGPVSAAEIARAEADALRLVLEAEGRIVATAATNGIGIRAFQILGVATAVACRNRGYARALCLALIRHLHAQGARHCVLFADRANTAARRCYEGIGFRMTGDFIAAKLAPPASGGGSR